MRKGVFEVLHMDKDWVVKVPPMEVGCTEVWNVSSLDLVWCNEGSQKVLHNF